MIFLHFFTYIGWRRKIKKIKKSRDFFRKSRGGVFSDVIFFKNHVIKSEEESRDNLFVLRIKYLIARDKLRDKLRDKFIVSRDKYLVLRDKLRDKCTVARDKYLVLRDKLRGKCIVSRDKLRNKYSVSRDKYVVLRDKLRDKFTVLRDKVRDKLRTCTCVLTGRSLTYASLVLGCFL